MMNDISKINSIDKDMITVVVPIYNAEKWLNECVSSLVSQSLKNISIILVDDGSSDRSGEICDEWVHIDQRIQVVHQANHGANYSRWIGVHYSKSEWIAFCDADDTFCPDGLEKMYRMAEDDTDIVIALDSEPKDNRVLSLEECRSGVLGDCKFSPAPFAKLFRKRILTEEVFDISRDIKVGEDAIMNTRIMFKTNKDPKFCFEKVYNYRRNSASLSHSKSGGVDEQDLFYREQRRFMPNDELHKYIKSIVKYKINGLIMPAWNEPEVLKEGKHPFLVQLKKEIIECGYKMNVQEWLLMNVKCKLGLKLLSFGIRAKNSLRYRLGLNN